VLSKNTPLGGSANSHSPTGKVSGINPRHVFRAIRSGTLPTLSFAILPFPFSLLPMPKPDKNDIERLSRGESTRGKIGNRGVGHRLTQKERILFEAAKRNGFLKIPVTGIRKNVLNVYRLWCQATDREFITK